jgi:hypothetical protein
MAKCKKCKLEAVYDSPANFCEKHWIDWWVDGLKPTSKKQRRELTKAAEAILHGLLNLGEAAHETQNLSSMYQRRISG